MQVVGKSSVVGFWVFSSVVEGWVMLASVEKRKQQRKLLKLWILLHVFISIKDYEFGRLTHVTRSFLGGFFYLAPLKKLLLAP